MPIRRSELIEVSWDDELCPYCGEEFEDCECSDEKDRLEEDCHFNPPEPEDDDQANWAGDTSGKNAY